MSTLWQTCAGEFQQLVFQCKLKRKQTQKPKITQKLHSVGLSDDIYVLRPCYFWIRTQDTLQTPSTGLKWCWSVPGKLLVEWDMT